MIHGPLPVEYVTAVGSIGQGYRDMVDEFIKHSDLVIIATPAATHADLVCAALEAGKPTLCEKPLCTTKEDLARVREVWERTGTPLLVDHTHLWHPDYITMRDAFASCSRIDIECNFGNEGECEWLEWSPHWLALGMGILGDEMHPRSRWDCSSARGQMAIIGPEFVRRERKLSATCGCHSELTVFNGDRPCDPPPLARVVDDFVNQRQDWRWGEFGFRVMELVLDGLNTSGA